MNRSCTRRARFLAVLKPLGLGALLVLVLGCGEGTDGASPSRPRAALSWGHEQRLEANDAAELDQFGYSVSLFEGRALVGAYGESLYRGAAYVYVRQGDAWIHEQKLYASDGVEGDSFGWSVSLDAERLLVGAYAHDSTRGAAYVFVKNGDSWVEEGKLVASDGVGGDSFGWSVSLSSNRALVGAFAQGDSRGAGYVFGSRDGVWSEEQKLVANEGREGDMLGYSVSLTGSSALLGAPGQEKSRGAAHVFAPVDGLWPEVATLFASDGAEDDHFGVSVSLAARGALIGAYSDESQRGAAYVYEERAGTFGEEQKLTASDGAPGHRFGNAVALGSDHALVGAYLSGDARGAAYSFARTGTGWGDEQKLVASDGLTSDFFGWSVALAADRALAGAHYDDVLRGAAYVFSLGPYATER